MLVGMVVGGDFRGTSAFPRPGGPATVGPYVLRALIGEGGMGRVYLARSPAGRSIAVKVVHPLRRPVRHENALPTSPHQIATAIGLQAHRYAGRRR
ncbi:hypothetical protein [Pseudofrankia sp. DC12]|uniref:hypothetical protein n=1 Tax=Pseudofrankia sp. DC12 TaxID=683315 RepID=UPI0005F7D85C|nr:hypothetical protein [Pseudofrankia sp. DC12]